jgi:23S rRNA (guanine745-N1)-methyltransferase
MVAAREAFLGAGHYAPLAARVAAAAKAAAASVEPDSRGARCVVELGAGTGYYLAAVVRALGWSGLALDSSRAALRRALAADPRIAGVVCDAWGPLPVRDGGADIVLSVFAPRNAPEIARILAPGGTLIVVTPTPAHLRELAEAVGMIGIDADKPARLRSRMAGELEPGGSERVEFAIRLDHDAVRAVVGMGPSAHHIDGPTLEERIAGLPQPVAVNAGLIVQTFVRPQAASSSSRLPQGSSA